MIRLENVTYSYDADRKPALENVNLTIPRGEFASIVGPNGGGKTTLIRLILGLLKPQKGTVLLFGDDPEKSRLRVGYTPQQARVDFKFPISVFDVVLAGRFGTREQTQPTEKKELIRLLASARDRLFFRFNADDRERASAALERMEVADLRDKAFGDLSGGQRQRVLIARALCSEPELLVLDEPTNNVDPSSAERFYETLADLNRDTSILMVSHDLGVVSERVRSVVCVNRVVRIHPTSEFNGDLVRELYRSDVRCVRHDHRCSEAGHASCRDGGDF
ncbi:MAG: metal ABC transporter ATP-binding protein [Thermoguttaceae bacterium]|nr:metal ABC transporter ATP-binding protein [Thermoguttaceae bacterium]